MAALIPTFSDKPGRVYIDYRNCNPVLIEYPYWSKGRASCRKKLPLFSPLRAFNGSSGRGARRPGGWAAIMRGAVLSGAATITTHN
jgi:hypothetical protein